MHFHNKTHIRSKLFVTYMISLLFQNILILKLIEFHLIFTNPYVKLLFNPLGHFWYDLVSLEIKILLKHSSAAICVKTSFLWRFLCQKILKASASASIAENPPMSTVSDQLFLKDENLRKILRPISSWWRLRVKL